MSTLYIDEARTPATPAAGRGEQGRSDGAVRVCASCDEELESGDAGGACIVCGSDLCGLCHTGSARCRACDAEGHKYLLVSETTDGLPPEAVVVETVGGRRIVRAQSRGLHGVAAPLAGQVAETCGAHLETAEIRTPVIVDSLATAIQVARLANRDVWWALPLSNRDVASVPHKHERRCFRG